MRLGLVIGHSLRAQGAMNSLGLSEFMYNRSLVTGLASMLATNYKLEPIVFYRGHYDELPALLNKSNIEIAIEFHCNAFNNTASGTETLYFHTSVKGKRLAKHIQQEVVKALELPDRGIKSVEAGGRGSLILRKTTMPCAITEPFFLDNDSDLATAKKKRSHLLVAYAQGIASYISTLNT